MLVLYWASDWQYELKSDAKLSKLSEDSQKKYNNNIPNVLPQSGIWGGKSREECTQNLPYGK